MMLLGKRARPPMKRNTSMTEFTLDFNPASGIVSSDNDPHNPFGGGIYPSTAVAPSPRPYRRNSADFVDSSFLRVCSFCQHRLIPGHDIYMYRGDSGFCSLECRQHQIIRDEKEKKKNNNTKSFSFSNKIAVAVTSAAIESTHQN